MKRGQLAGQVTPGGQQAVRPEFAEAVVSTRETAGRADGSVNARTAGWAGWGGAP
jgi:hypothetical protein